MELQTISQVANECGVTTRMLRYYEEIGLIVSLRKGDGSYRVYDEGNIQKLRQIIVLRKLRISVKQIIEILNNPNAAVIIDIFKKNIDELDNEITTLATVKLILNQFVDKISQAASIKLELDFSSDENVLSAIETLSFSKNQKKENLPMENVSMEALNRLDKYPKQTPARIVYLPPATIAVVVSTKRSHEADAYKALVKFAEDTDLLRIKPDTRTFGYDLKVGDMHGYKAWITIPDDLEVSEPFEKSSFPGGLYACHTRGVLDLNFDEANFIHEWVHNHEEFEFDERAPIGIYRTLEEQYKLSPYMLSGKAGDYLHIDFLIPIKISERKLFIKQQKEREKAGQLLAEERKNTQTLQDIVTAAVSTPRKTTDINVPNIISSGEFATAEVFMGAILIKTKLKTDGDNLKLSYGKGMVMLNRVDTTKTPPAENLFIHDITSGKAHNVNANSHIPKNEFVDIEWIIGNEVIAIRINNELLYASDQFEYINDFKVSTQKSQPIRITPAEGTTIAVEFMQVMEL